MNKLHFLVCDNIFTEDEILTFLSNAREGDKYSQLKLLDICFSFSKTIALKYKSYALSCGISFQDLKDLVNEAYYESLKRYVGGQLTFIDFFKFCYLRAVQTEIRRKQNLNFKCINIGDNGCILENNQKLTKSEDEAKNIIKNELTKKALSSDMKLLSLEEKRYLKAYIDGYSIREISEIRKEKYHDVRRKFKKILIKIRDYIGDSSKE